MCGSCGDATRVPCATKLGDPHLHICGCRHRWVAPLGSDPKCPGCTDEHGHSAHERQIMRMAKSAIEHYGIDAVMRQ